MLVLDRRDLRYLRRAHDLLRHMPDFPIVDPHMHLWDLERIRYPWLTPPLPVGITGDVSAIARTYRLDDYFRDVSAEGTALRVAKVVHVEAGAEPEDSLAETCWLQSIADARGFPQALVVHVELQSPQAAAQLAEHAGYRNVRGVRQILNWHSDPAKSYTPRDLLQNAAWQRGFALLRRHGLSFDLQIYPAQMPDAARLASRHPDTPLVLNHAGMPVDRDAAGLEAWRSGMKALAQQPNVTVKISGLAMLDWRWTPESIRPFVLETLELFGVDRCMFASNFPVDRLFGPFARSYAAYERLLAGCSAAELRKLFAANAERVYRI